jgi:capsular polysaccharide biosynthesis protein
VAREIGPSELNQPADPARDDGALTPLHLRVLHWIQGSLARRVFAAEADPAVDELRAATKVLREQSSVSNDPRSSVIQISSTSSTPEMARLIVQSLANAFIQRHRDRYSIQALLERSRAQLDEARLVRDKAAQAYVDQVSQSGVSVLETQVPRLETELSSLEGEVFAARVRREEIGRTRLSLSNRLQGLPSEVEIQRPPVMVPNEDYETQLALKRLLLAQKQELLIRERPSEERQRRETEFESQIAKTDERLKATPKITIQGSDMQQNLGRAAMQARIADVEIEDEGLLVKLGLLDARVEAKRTRCSELQKQLMTATMVRKDLGASRDALDLRYAQLLGRFSVLEGLETIDASTEANLSVLEAPTLELDKVGPKRGALLFKGLLFGMVAAVCFAFLRAQFQRRLSYPESFEHARGVPVLGVVPRLPALRQMARRARAGSG